MTKKTIINGTPFEAGNQAWERMVAPLLVAANGRPDQEVQQFYVGLLVSAMGSMAADFGHARALEMMSTLVDTFAGMAGELKGSRTQ